MNLLFVSTPTEKPITAMATHKKLIYAASGNCISTYKRGKEVYRVGGKGDFNIIQILTLGAYIAALCDDNTLKLWDTHTGGNINNRYMYISF
jgi:U3 small nucleolar RNA-associated protein 21